MITAAYDCIERFDLAAVKRPSCCSWSFSTGLRALTIRPGGLMLLVVFGAYAFAWATVSTTLRQRAAPTARQGRVGGR